MLLGFDVIIHAVYHFRNIWIKGRYGGGKTFLAFVLAQQLLKSGLVNGVYSNVANTVGTPYYASDSENLVTQGVVNPGDLCKTCVVYDEAWLTLGLGSSPKEIKKYLAFLRKRELILLMPSVLPIARSGFSLWIERAWNLGAVGLPLWVYRWGVAGETSKKSGGAFYILFPQKFFGLYDTLAQPKEIEGLFNVK